MNLRELAYAAAAGAIAYLVSCLLVWPEATAAGFGGQWQLMSEAPFELRGQLPHRLLAPLLAWLCGMGGGGYVVFVRGLTVVMLGVVFLYSRQLGGTLSDALLVTLAVAITAPVQNYKLHWVGYADPLCYLLLLLAAMAARRPWLCWGLLFVDLFNHELAVFFVPWLWYLRRRADGRWALDLTLLGAALGLYGAFYLYVKAHAPQQLFDMSYFLEHPLFPGGTLLVWSLAAAHWALAFGPVLAVVAWHQHTRTFGAERRQLWLVMLGVLVVFCIAYDYSRHANLILPVFALAATRFLQAGHRAVFAGLLVVTGVVLGVPGLHDGWPPWSPTPWPMHEHLVIPAFQTGVVVVSKEGYGFGPPSAFFAGWLPTVWRTLVPVLSMLSAIWLAGALFARIRNPEHAAPARSRRLNGSELG